MNKVCIGIDIAKTTFMAAVKINDKYKVKSFSNNEKGFTHLLEWLNNIPAEHYHFCMESTGKYSVKLSSFLYDKNHVVSVVNPAKIKHFMRSQLTRNKTDPVAAQIIARYCELFIPAQWNPEPMEIQTLRAVVNRLDALINMGLQEQNRLENVEIAVKESITDTIDYLKKEMEKIEDKIKKHIDSHPQLKEKSDLLKSIPGVGEKTANKVLAFLNNMEKFNKAKQVAAFIGLTPQHRQSGSSLNHSYLSCEN